MEPTASQRHVRFDLEAGPKEESQISDDVQEEVEKKEEAELVEVIKVSDGDSGGEMGMLERIEETARQRSRSRARPVNQLATVLDDVFNEEDVCDWLKPLLLTILIVAVVSGIVALNYYAF